MKFWFSIATAATILAVTGAAATAPKFRSERELGGRAAISAAYAGLPSQ